MPTSEVQGEDMGHLVVLGETRPHDPRVVREPYALSLQLCPGPYAMVPIQHHAIAIKLDGDQHAVGTNVRFQGGELVW
jgi:hypothetical protein